LINLASCGRSAVVAVIFSRNIFSHPAALSLTHLSGFVVGVGRDAGIAVNHVSFCIGNLHVRQFAAL